MYFGTPFVFYQYMEIINRHSDRVILGIDPGTLNFGYCVLFQHDRTYQIYTRDIFFMHDKDDDQVTKNKKIYGLLEDLYDTYKFDEVSIEQPVFGKDPQSMLKLGRVLGCCIGFTIAHGIPVFEYLPKNIKKVITGNGNAAKQQVAFMVAKILGFAYEEKSRYDDSDAAAIALCHAFATSGVCLVDNKKSWDKFIKDNPDRIL